MLPGEIVTTFSPAWLLGEVWAGAICVICSDSGADTGPSCGLTTGALTGPVAADAAWAFDVQSLAATFRPGRGGALGIGLL